VRLATSDEHDAPEALAAFRLTAEPAIPVTVAMAYEGMDAPEVAVVAALTHIRSRPWLEQMIARATRVDPHAGSYDRQSALVFHPDDPLFGRFRRSIEAEQGLLARHGKRKGQAEMPEWLAARLAEHRDEGEGRGITPLESNALGLRYATLKSRFETAQPRSGWSGSPFGPAEPPSAAERRLRTRIGEAIVAQAVEDEPGVEVPRLRDRPLHGRDPRPRRNGLGGLHSHLGWPGGTRPPGCLEQGGSGGALPDREGLRHWKRSYGLRRMRWLGLDKAGLQVRLTATAYNLRRTMVLVRAQAA
jgi:hypothetical protein